MTSRDAAAALPAVPLLALMAFLMAGPASRQTPTIDEVAHIGAGLSYLQQLDLRLNGEHPPLAKIVAAAPLAIQGAKADYTSQAWTFSEKFFPAYLAQWVFGEWVLGRWNPRQPTVASARMPMLLLTIALGCVIYWCAFRVGGVPGALLSLSAYVSAPVFLTFGPLVLTDVPLVLFSLLTLVSFASLWISPRRGRIAVFALFLAAALLSKFSAALLLVAVAVFVRYGRLRPIAAPAGRRALVAGIAAAFVLVYAAYFVLSWNQPMDVQHRIGDGSFAAAVGRALMPPWLYLRGMAMVLFTASRPAFLLGETHPQGLPVYFPLLLVWKMPPGFIGLLLLGGASCVLLRRTRLPIPESQHGLWRVLWISCVVVTAACLLSRLNISFRHFTLPLALLMVLLAPLPNAIRTIAIGHRRTGLAMTAALIVCSIGSMLSAVSAYPHFLPYTSALAGATPAYFLYGDSNLDWNHALRDVQEFAEAKGLAEMLVDSYGLSDPAVDAPRARVWDCQSPAPSHGGRRAVVSANALLETHNCSWLLPHIEQPLAGGSMYVVRLPDPVPSAGSRTGPPLPSQQKKLFSLPVDLRAMMIEVTQEPHTLPAVYAELERRLAPSSIADDLYPPKDPVRWPWQQSSSKSPE